MANFAQDNFVATVNGNIVGQNDQLGNTWALGSGSANNNNIDNSVGFKTYNSSATFLNTWARNPGPPPSANYTVQCDIYINTSSNVVVSGVAGRMASGADTYYYAIANVFGPYWELGKHVAGVNTSLGTSAQTFVSGTTYSALQLVMSGTTISLVLNGSTLISVTDTDIASAGFSGLFSVGDNSERGALVTTFFAFPNASSVVFRRTLSQFGTRTGSRQVMLG